MSPLIVRRAGGGRRDGDRTYLSKTVNLQCGFPSVYDMVYLTPPLDPFSTLKHSIASECQPLKKGGWRWKGLVESGLSEKSSFGVGFMPIAE